MASSGNSSNTSTYSVPDTYDYDGYYEYYIDHIYEIFDFEIPIYGYVWPFLVLFTTCCNILVIAGFLRRRMRNQNNIILISIAISDSLTGLVTLPATFHVFAHENVILTKDWCEAAMITRLYVARAFHTVSVWQTLLLGVQRYLQIRNPLNAERFCTMSKTLIAIAVLYIGAFILHIYHAFNIKAMDGWCQWQLEDPCGWSCVYLWCALLFGHLLPCVVLIVLAFCMARTLKRLNGANIETQPTGTRKRTERSRNITIVVITIVVIFLIPELPYGIFYLTVVSLRHSKQQLFPLRINRMIHCIYELLLVLSFHLNFWVYCILVKSFRSCLKGILRLVMCQPVTFSRLEGETSSSDAANFELVDAANETDNVEQAVVNRAET